jgi:hypothetical protein
MKSISASVVVLAGAVLVTAGLSGSDIEHKIVLLAGGAVGLLGLIGWILTLPGRTD